LGCITATIGQEQNGRDATNVFVENKFSTTYEDYRDKGDNFQFHHWVGYFNDREKLPVTVWFHSGALMMDITTNLPSACAKSPTRGAK
jgi:hypothetical protein